MIKYKLKKILIIVSKKAKVKGKLQYEIYVQENCYKLKLYDAVELGETTVKLPICTFSISKDRHRIESAEHGYILVTKWNKLIVSSIGNLTCSIIEDFADYIPRRDEDESRTNESVEDSTKGNIGSSRD
ncbi:MAG: hypothetical protein ACRDA3_13205 [Peptostreptococcaceae bacterium]